MAERTVGVLPLLDLLKAIRSLGADPRHLRRAAQAVAMQAGFADPAAFSKAFRRRMGCSPSGYRKRLAG